MREYITQCCSGVSIADFEQVVAAQDVVLTFVGCWLLWNLENRKKSSKVNQYANQMSFAKRVLHYICFTEKHIARVLIHSEK